MKRLTVLLLIMVGVVCGYVPAEAQPMAGSDQQVLTNNIQSTLEYNQTNQTAPWVNPDTGNSGATVPVRTFNNAGGQPCREFVSTIVVAGEEQQGYGTACRQPDGTWQIASGEGAVATAVAPPVEKRIYGYNEPRPYGYYPYAPYGYYPYGYYGNYAPWYGWYPAFWSYPVSFSFGFIHTKGHGHHHHFRGHSGHSFKSAGFRGHGFSGGHSFRSGGQGFRSGGGSFRSGGGSIRSGGGSIRSGGGGLRSGGGGGRR